jgi:hypothetical protein
LVDADACPVKEEIYKVAYRRNVAVVLVSNARFRMPDHPLITRVVVSDSFDAADDWIAEQAGPRSVVITADILLADRCLKAGAVVIGNNGKPSPAPPSAAPSPPARSWPTCAQAWTASPEAPLPLPKPTGQGFCRRWMRRW